MRARKDRRDGVQRIADERKRQLGKRSARHDDTHNDGQQLARAAVCYATPVKLYEMSVFATQVLFQDPWPWGSVFDSRPHSGNVVDRSKQTVAERVRELEKAGALIAAEIDRLLRKDDQEEKAKS